MKIEDRFFSHVEKTEGCWLWTGCLDRDGYGASTLNGKRVFSHRLAYELFVDSIPNGYVIDHLCSVKSCVNPDHLEAVTPRENIVRAIRYWGGGGGRKKGTHCKRGHLLKQYAKRQRCLTCARGTA